MHPPAVWFYLKRILLSLITHMSAFFLALLISYWPPYVSLAPYKRRGSPAATDPLPDHTTDAEQSHVSLPELLGDGPERAGRG
jgi:hypothetical protein